MNMPLRSELAATAPVPAAAGDSVIVALPSKQVAFRTKLIDAATAVFARVAPPLIVVALLLGLWELLCRKSGCDAATAIARF